VVGPFLIQRITQIPAMRQVAAGRLNEVALGADPLEDHDQLQLEKHDQVDAGPAARGRQLVHPVADEAQVELGLQVAVEVVGGTRSSSETMIGSSRQRGFGGPSIESLLPLRGDAGLSLGDVCRLRTLSV
jgi:hypothetical protein